MFNILQHSLIIWKVDVSSKQIISWLTLNDRKCNRSLSPLLVCERVLLTLSTGRVDSMSACWSNNFLNRVVVGCCEIDICFSLSFVRELLKIKLRALSVWTLSYVDDLQIQNNKIFKIDHVWSTFGVIFAQILLEIQDFVSTAAVLGGCWAISSLKAF